MSYLREDQKAKLDEAVEEYVAALNDLDAGRFLACFRGNCLVRDPHGSSIYRGTDELHQYIDTMRNTWSSFQLAPGRRYYGGSGRVAFTWEASATAHNGKTATFDGITVLTLESGLIDGLEAYWDAPAMFEQIKD